MKFKTFAAVLVIAGSALPALAADQVVDLSSGAASFIGTAPLLDAGDEPSTLYPSEPTVTPPAVPEPQTYAMILAGLGAVIFLLRRRRGD